MNRRFPKISIVIPARNSGQLITKCLNSLKNLNYPKDKFEIIISDGCSTDATAKIAQSLGARVVINKKGVVVSGRNVGFKATSGELVAFTDDDCTFDKNWLKNAVKYFEDEKVGGISGPNLIPVSEKPFSRAVGLIFDMAFFFGAGSPTKKMGKVIESRSHGSNAIYRSSVLRKVFPIDETLVEGEDVLMTQKINDLGYKLLYVPDVMVNHFRRATPDRWWNQMLRYSQAKVLLQRRQVKQVTLVQKLTGFLFPIIVLCLLAIIVLPKLMMIYLAIFIATLVSLFIYSLIQSHSFLISLSFIEAFFIMIVAWSYGYLKEYIYGTNKKMIHK